MILSGVWEPTPFENILLKSLYLIYYAVPISIILLIIAVILLIFKKITKKKER